jgi:hypothetical protein
MSQVLQSLKGIISPVLPTRKLHHQYVYRKIYHPPGSIKEKMNTDVLSRTLARMNKYGFKRMALLLILFLWVIYTFMTGNRLLGVLILIFIFLNLFSVPYIVPVAVLMFVLILFQTPIVNTGSAILDAYRGILGNPGQALSDLFTPASGQAGLPPQARRALSLLEDHHIEHYRLSNQILDNPLISQRITEMVWPRRIDQSSPYLILFLEEEKNYPVCTIIDEKKDMALDYCP